STGVPLIERAANETKDVASTYDSQPDAVGFSADSKRLFVRGARGTVDRVYAIDVAANRVVGVSASEGAIAEANLSDGATYIGLAAQSLDKPVEAYVTRVDRYAP